MQEFSIANSAASRGHSRSALMIAVRKMKVIFIIARWLTASIVVSLFATTAHAETRTVKLTVNVMSVVDWKPLPVAGANVTLTPSTGGPALDRETSSDGSVTVDVPLGAPGFGEGWLLSEPSIQIAVKKDSQIGASTVNVRTKDFKTTSVIEMVRTVTLSPPPAPLTATSVTRLMVRVVDEMGNPISGASVNITRDTLGPEFQYGSSIQTSPDGVASTDLATKGNRPSEFGEGWLYAPTFDLEVRKESLSGKDTFKLIGGKTAAGFRYPESITRTVILRGVEGKKEATIHVQVNVKDDAGDVEGASVVIWDTSLGVASGRFSGVTGGDGRVTIPVLYGSADAEESLPVEVSKTGYKPTKIFIALKAKQVGQTVFGGAASLEKSVAGGTKVTVTVLNNKNKQPVGDAKVILDGGGSAYYSDTTGGIGVKTFDVAQSGTLKVQISHDDYLSYSGEIRVLQGQEKPLKVELEPKANKGQGEDTIEVTVLGKDSTDEKSKPAPIKGAYVKAGTISAETDERGVATLTAAFAETQEVTVQVNGYKIKTQNVRVNKTLHMSAGSGKATFTLDPELSDTSPIRLQIEVRDASGNAIPNAVVELLTLSGERAGGGSTDAAGNYTFNSSEFEGALSELRKGLQLKVVAKGYQYVERRSVPAEMLKPSTKTGEFIVQLDKNWSDLRKAIDDLEPRVLAWNNELAAANQELQGLLKLKAEVTQISQKAGAISDEIDQAKIALPAVYDPSVAIVRCKEVERLKANIEGYSKDATAKEQELRKTLDQAKAMAATCSKAWEGEAIGKLYEDALRVTGAIGVLEKKAVKDANSLKDFAKEQTEFKKTVAKVEIKISELGEQATKAADVAARAGKSGMSAQKTKATLGKGLVPLWGELANLKKTYGLDKPVEPVPEDLLKRVDAMNQLLSNGRGDVFASSTGLGPLHEIEDAATEISNKKQTAESLLTGYKNKKGLCDIESMDDTVEAIGAIVTGATLELGAGADLVSACVAKANEAKDEVTVPDVSSGGDDPGALLAAAAPFTGTLVATNNPPPAGTTKLFSNQDPLASTKANPKTKPIKIFIYQAVAEAAKSPSSSAPSDLITVPDVSGFNDPDAMLAAAGPDMVGMIIATNKTPPKGSTKLFDHQDPSAGTKSERGKSLQIFIYQSLVDASPSQTVAPGPAAPPAVPADKGTMPFLVGLTIEQASALLPADARIGSDEIGDKPKTPEKALTIYFQYPPAGQRITDDVSITIRRFGSADSTVESTPALPPDSESSKPSGPTDITNTTGGDFWKSTPPPAKKSASLKKATPPPNKKKKSSDWWRQHGHDRPDYEVPNN